MRCLTDCKLLSSVVFIMYTVSLPLVYVSTQPIVFLGMNQRSTTHQGEYCAFFSEDHEFMVGVHFTFCWLYYVNRDDQEAIDLTKSDIKCLDPKAFLSSPVINFYIKYVATLYYYYYFLNYFNVLLIFQTNRN